MLILIRDNLSLKAFSLSFLFLLCFFPFSSSFAEDDHGHVHGGPSVQELEAKLEVTSGFVDLTHDLVEELLLAGKDYKSSGITKQINVTLPLGKKIETFTYSPHEIRATDYESFVSSHSGLNTHDSDIYLFKTEDSDTTFSRLTLSYLDNKISIQGFIKLDDSYYSFDSIEGNPEVVDIRELNQSEVAALIQSCGLKAPEVLNDKSFKPSNFLRKTVTLKQLELAAEVDYSYQTQAGGVDSALTEVVSILNSVDGIYRSQLGISIKLVHTHVWQTTNEPYNTNDPDSLLDQLRAQYIRIGNSLPNYDVGLLFTGKNLIDENTRSQTVGNAWLSSACSSFRYALVQRFSSKSLSVPLAAHEIAHTLGAPHDVCSSSDNFIMCPQVEPGAENFSNASKSAVTNFSSNAVCLSTILVDDSTISGVQSNTVISIEDISPKNIKENSLLSFKLAATHPQGKRITFSSSNLPAGATLSGDTFSWRPNYNTVIGGLTYKVFTVSFKATDSDNQSASTLARITVANTNRSPLISSNSSTLSFKEGETIRHQLTASDPDSDILTFSGTGLPSGAAINLRTGLLTWVPNFSQAGTYTIRATVKDVLGASSSTSLRLVIANNTVSRASATVSDFDNDNKADLAVARPFGNSIFVKLSSSSAVLPKTLGVKGDVKLTADYNGDDSADFASFDPKTAKWSILLTGSNSVKRSTLGDSNSLPVAADFDGDSKTDIAVFQPLKGKFTYISSVSGRVVDEKMGYRGDIPVPCDYNGDGIDDFAVYRLSSGQWLYKEAGGAQKRKNLGLAGDIPVPGDYRGTGSCQHAVWRPSTGQWFVDGLATEQFGLGGDIPVPIDINGDGKINKTVFRTQEGAWYYKVGSRVTTQSFGLSWDYPLSISSLFYSMRNASGFDADERSPVPETVGIYNSPAQKVVKVASKGISVLDRPAPRGSQIAGADFNGNGKIDDVVFNGGFWTIYNDNGTVDFNNWGLPGDIAVPADYDGDGKSDLAVWRPSNGGWYIIGSRKGAFIFYQYGLAGDIPIPGDFNGDGWTDPAVWRPSSGFWFVLDSRSGMPLESTQFGLNGDIPLIGDLDRDGRLDKLVWRSSVGRWYYLNSGGGTIGSVAWGLPGDIPSLVRYFDTNEVDFSVFRPSDGRVYVRSQTGASAVRNSWQARIGATVVQSSSIYFVN